MMEADDMDENFVTRDEAEIQIKEAIDDYLAEGILQEILDIIYGAGEFYVTNNIEGDEDDG